MTQEPPAETRSRAGVTLRLGAVLAASGPVILTSSGAGGQGLEHLLFRTNSIHYRLDGFSAPSVVEGPVLLKILPGELLFWSVLLLPVVVAALLPRGSRRATIAAVTAIGVVLAFGLLTAFLAPGLDPDTGERAAAPPWPMVVCYPVAAGALLLAARSPLPRRRHGLLPWAGAVAAAAWTAMSSPPIPPFDVYAPGLLYVVAPQSPWTDLVWWSCQADGLGLAVVLVTLAAAVRVTASARWGRVAGSAAAVVLLLLALLDVMTYVDEYGSDFQSSLADAVRWNLLLAAGLVTAATWGPGTPVDGAGTTHRARLLIQAWSREAGRERTKHLAVALVIAAAAVWLVLSSITPTR
ncbi:hypothetical protein [Streptosporangium sp. NPDC023615]|uniref:hypothetical protein n=1 Tax=Streptosporangium sp. NPDC023615 TaxID=3154794 RepID=UPI0034147A8C